MRQLEHLAVAETILHEVHVARVAPEVGGDRVMVGGEARACLLHDADGEQRREADRNGAPPPLGGGAHRHSVDEEREREQREERDATSNRARSLRVTLDALRHQTYRDFEVIVLQGPCEDDTDALLAERAEDLRVVHNPERNLSMSRNLGIDLAAGEIVAFIDDDANPEPGWLDELDGPTAPAMWRRRWAGVRPDGCAPPVPLRDCDRVGDRLDDLRPPFDEFSSWRRPIDLPQGTNMAFRRDPLVEIGGFDEENEYYLGRDRRGGAPDRRRLAARAVDEASVTTSSCRATCGARRLITNPFPV